MWSGRPAFGEVSDSCLRVRSGLVPRALGSKNSHRTGKEFAADCASLQLRPQFRAGELSRPVPGRNVLYPAEQDPARVIHW
jgi:hypothetical protein